MRRRFGEDFLRLGDFPLFQGFFGGQFPAQINLSLTAIFANIFSG